MPSPSRSATAPVRLSFTHYELPARGSSPASAQHTYHHRRLASRGGFFRSGNNIHTPFDEREIIFCGIKEENDCKHDKQTRIEVEI